MSHPRVHELFELVAELPLSRERQGVQGVRVVLILALVGIAICVGVYGSVRGVIGIEAEEEFPTAPHRVIVLVLVIHLAAIEPQISIGIV